MGSDEINNNFLHNIFNKIIIEMMCDLRKTTFLVMAVFTDNAVVISR